MSYEKIKYALSFFGLLVLPFTLDALLGPGASPLVYAVLIAITGTAVFYAATRVARRWFPQVRRSRLSIAILFIGIAALGASDQRQAHEVSTFGVAVQDSDWWPTEWECLRLTEDEAVQYGVYFRCTNFSWSWGGTDI